MCSSAFGISWMKVFDVSWLKLILRSFPSVAQCSEKLCQRALDDAHTIYSSKPGGRHATTYHRRTSVPTCSSPAKRRPSARTRELRRTARRSRTARSNGEVAEDLA